MYWVANRPVYREKYWIVWSDYQVHGLVIIQQVMPIINPHFLNEASRNHLSKSQRRKLSTVKCVVTGKVDNVSLTGISLRSCSNVSVTLTHVRTWNKHTLRGMSLHFSVFSIRLWSWSSRYFLSRCSMPYTKHPFRSDVPWCDLIYLRRAMKHRSPIIHIEIYHRGARRCILKPACM